MRDLRLMAEETGDDDFSDVRLGGVGRTEGDTHISDQKKAVKGEPIESFDGGRESNKMDREDRDRTSGGGCFFLSLLGLFFLN